MVHSVKYQGRILYVCEICGLSYATKSMAKACEEFCSKNGACSLEIAAHAVKRE